MQPYAYIPYPNPNGATMPIHQIAPTRYQQPSPPFIRYAAIPPTVPTNQYVPQPLYYPTPVLPPPPPPPPPVSTTMPMMPVQQFPQQQYPAGYYYVPNGYKAVRPAVMTNSQPAKNVPKKGAKEHKDSPQNQAMKGLIANNNANDLLKHKGTKVRVSKIYRITKQKPGFHGNDSSEDDEYEQIPLDSPQPRTTKQPAAHAKHSTAQIPRPASSCSHCSRCSNCSCSECRHQNRKHLYDDCPECRAEWEREQVQRRREKHK